MSRPPDFPRNAKNGSGDEASEEAEGEASGAGRDEENNLEQIEYLLYQSTQGIHFMFDHAEAAKVLREAGDDCDFDSFSNSEKVQDMLSRFIQKSSLNEKRLYLETLGETEYKLLVRAYFHLVENTILAGSSLRH